MTTFTSLISTAIPYVNARPHLGFAYELVLADVLARHRRRRGHDVHFITGTDENSLKNVVAATREGLSTRELVDRNADAFRALGPLLGVEPDDFIRTSVDTRHRAAVESLWRACAGRGDLYRRAWHGRYCPGCEAFVEDDVIVCDEHGIPPEPVSEENWFFRLSRYREPIRDAIASGRLAIVPEAARAETLAFLDGEVRDLSVSRVASRSGGWGIPVPDDPTQVIYVWFDALANYILSPERWRGSDERAHVIGKGITRFHAVYWPAFLLSAGLPLPHRLLVHGYLKIDGEKIRKSGKNVEVAPVVEEVGADALRWYFVRCCRTRADADVSIDAITGAYDHDLADGLGNLVQRLVSLAVRTSNGRVPPTALTAPTATATTTTTALTALADALPARVDAAVDVFLFDDAVGAIVELVAAANRYLEVSAPWRLARTDPAAAAQALAAPLQAARVAVGELEPFVPGVAATLAARLAEPLTLGPPPLPRKGVR